MNLKSNWLAITLSIAAIVISLSGVLKKDNTNLCAVDLKYLFENFEYKKEMQKDFDQVIKYRSQYLDSLKQVYTILVQKPLENKERIAQMEYTIRGTSEEFKESSMMLSQDMDKKIYKQLKQYIREYMQSTGVKLVMGELEDQLGFVTVPSDEKTKEVMAFINNAYKNKK